MLGIGPIVVHRKNEMIVIDAQRQVSLRNSIENRNSIVRKEDMESKETEDEGFHWMADSSNCGLLFRGRRKTHSHCFNHEDKQVGSCDGFELFDV